MKPPGSLSTHTLYSTLSPFSPASLSFTRLSPQLFYAAGFSFYLNVDFNEGHFIESEFIVLIDWIKLFFFPVCAIWQCTDWFLDDFLGFHPVFVADFP